jgi:PAS domain S-box-containing protein
MSFQIGLYIGPLAIAAILSAGLAVVAWRRRPTPGAAALSALMLTAVYWTIAYSLEIIAVDLEVMLFWTRMEYLAILAVPVLWLIFVLQFSGHGQWVTPRFVAGLAAFPTLTFILIWTPAGLSLLYRETIVQINGSMTWLVVTYGPLFWLQAIYSYVLIVFAVLLVLLALLRGGVVQRTQNGAVLAAALTPLIGNAIYVFGLSPLLYVDLTPFLFIITGIVSLWALFRYHLLDLMPVVRDVLIERMTDGVAVVDAQGRVVDLNRAAQQMIGQQTSALLGASAATVVPEWPHLIQQSRLEQPARMQVITGSEDSRVYYDVRVSPLLSDGETVQGWLAVFRDDTTRVRAEQTEQQQRALIEGLRDALGALTSTLSIDEVLDRILELTASVVPHEISNIMLIEDGWAAVQRMRGYSASELPGIHNLRLNVLDTPNLRRMAETHQPLAIGDTQQDPNWMVVPGTGWLRSYAAAPIISKGRAVGFLNLDSSQPGHFTQQHAQALKAFADQVGIALENASLYASLQESNAKLSLALRAREEAIQNVSHELRTPLTLMLGYVEFMANGELGPVTSDQANALRVVALQGRRLQFIFNSLLTLQTFQPKDIHLEFMDCRTWLDATLDTWRQVAAVAGLTIRLVLPDHLPPVMGAANYLDLALGNLLDNAIKFSASGRAITVSAREEGAWVIISVADQGIGVSTEQLNMIFERFYQVDSTSTRRHGGMGIGLALCQAIVQAHNGRVWGESAGPGQGATFFIALPVADPPAAAPGT